MDWNLRLLTTVVLEETEGFGLEWRGIGHLRDLDRRASLSELAGVAALCVQFVQ